MTSLSSMYRGNLNLLSYCLPPAKFLTPVDKEWINLNTPLIGEDTSPKNP